MKNPTSLLLIILFFLSGQFIYSQNVTNNGSAITVMEGATLTVMGNFTNLSEVTIDNSGDIFIGGDWINNAPDRIDMKENTGTVTFNGISPQTIGGLSETHFSTLQLEQDTELGSETKVSTLLGLTNARLTLNDHHFLVGSGAEITGAGTDAFIVAENMGLLVREVGAIDVEFPIGTSNSFLPVTLNNSGTLDNYGINLFQDVRDGGLTGFTIPEIDHCVNNTWNILEELEGDSDLSITVQWNASDEGSGFNRSMSGLGHFTDDAWNPQDATTALGDDPYTLTRTGITSLSAFAVGDNNSPMVVAIVYDEQNIMLSQGWSGISSYLQPVDPDVEEILSPVINELVILQNQLGMYWPGQGINTLGDWNTHSGYQIKMSGEIQLTITGTIETNTTLNLFEGWNLIPVISTCGGVDVAELFTGTSVVMVMEVAGTAMYWPEFSIGTLEKLLPGSAYMVLMDADEDIVFPACSKAQSLAGNNSEEVASASLKLKEASAISGKAEITPTPNIHAVAVPVSAFDGIDIAYGDILEAFDEDNNCFGLAQWYGKAMSISLFGDDQTTTVSDGFGEGNVISFKLFRAGSGEEILLEANYNKNLPDNSGLFVINGISSITSFKSGATGINGNNPAEISIYPNPATDKISISYHSETEATLNLYNIHGLEVMSLIIDQATTDVNISMLAPGPYLIKINNGEFSFVQRLIVN